MTDYFGHKDDHMKSMTDYIPKKWGFYSHKPE